MEEDIITACFCSKAEAEAVGQKIIATKVFNLLSFINETINGGAAISTDAKIIGITPDIFIFKGR